jgi:putative toxin-antitoxin system antitoxin component (TIGR02293 family)
MCLDLSGHLSQREHRMSIVGRIQSKVKKPLTRKPAAGAAVATPPAPRPAALPSAWSQLKLQRDMTGLRAHDLVTKGVSVAAAKQVMGAFQIINEAQLYDVLGISSKTMQRRSASAAKTLDSNASGRALRLVSVTSQAIDVLGSQEAAERWLASPAVGLDRRKPIDLLRSTEGTEMIKTLLTRMDYGVYA